MRSSTPFPSTSTGFSLHHEAWLSLEEGDKGVVLHPLTSFSLHHQPLKSSLDPLIALLISQSW